MTTRPEAHTHTSEGWLVERTAMAGESVQGGSVLGSSVEGGVYVGCVR